MLRIASLLASATEILCGMGLGESLVAISHECDYPPEVLHLPRVTRTRIDPLAGSLAIDEQVRSFMQGGDALYDIDVQRLCELRPDLIVTQAQCDVCAVRLADVQRAVAERQELQGARIVALQPNSLGEVLEDILRVGEAAGAAEAARGYVARLQQRMEAVRQQTATLCAARRRRVALIEWIEPLMLAANWMPELVELAGGEHALTVAGKHSPYIAWEEVRRYDPEVIVITPCGFDLPRTLQEVPLLAALPGWQATTAFQAQRIYAMDGNAYFNRSGPRLVDSLEILAHLIWPEEVERPGCVKEADSVWRRILQRSEEN